MTAFFVAFNPIWGFSWYFNTESWATGVYQKMTELRVDPWRVGMIDAVTRAYGGDDDELFRIRPDGVDGAGDFSFLVIGDPGEGDASQYSLISRYLKLGLDDDVKFLVVSSDVIYPAGLHARLRSPISIFHSRVSPSRSMRSRATTIGSMHSRASTRTFSSPRRRVRRSKHASMPILD